MHAPPWVLARSGSICQDMDAFLTSAIVLSALAALVVTRVPAEAVFVGALTLLMAAGVLTPGEALAGFGNEAVASIAALYVVAAAMRDSGAVTWISMRLLGRPRSVTGAQARLMAPVALVSGFLNNTPVVAVMIPAVSEWARRHRISASKVMLPLSYAAILGGSLTIIGTSTNLVVNGLLSAAAARPLGFFEITRVGLPTAVIGIVATIVLARRLLPERKSAMERLADPREYSVEMTVDPGGPLVGKTVEAAGLRHLGNVFLIEVDRGGMPFPAVSPHFVLEAGDRLVFVGVVDSVVDLQRMPGLLPAAGQVFKLDGRRDQRILVEAVVSEASPLAGRSIREGRFRTHYGAAVVAVARNAERLRQKVGDVVLRPGDTLLLEADPEFVPRQRNQRDFYLVSPVPDSSPPRVDRIGWASAVLAAVVAAAAFGWLPMVTAAMLGAGGMLLTRSTTLAAARRSVNWSVLLVIGAAFGLGRALETSGVAETVASALTSLAGPTPIANLIALYVVTATFTALITNNAAAVLMFPVAQAMAHATGASITPFAVTLMMAASASFATPIGYQTNLMVMGPGGYRFRDYLVLGLPLTIVTGLVTLALVTWSWPLTAP